MMACLSDIDLATLHKNRLEERLNYKLAWSANTHNHHHHHRHHHHEEAYYHHQRRQQQQQQKLQQQQQQQQLHLDGFNEMTRKCLQRTMVRNTSECNPLNREQHVDDVNDNITTKTTTTVNLIHNDADNNGISNELNKNLTKLNLNDSKSKNEQRINQVENVTSIDSMATDENCNYFTSTTRRTRSGTWPRTRSLNAPSPFQKFGPCGRIMKNSAMVMQIQDPASQRLTWYKPPLTVLVIKKVRDCAVLAPFVQLVEWLVQEKNMVVWVESAVLDDPLLQKDKRFQNIKEKLVTFKDGRDDITDRIDFIVCLGGDGTLLYASLLFQESVPPVMAFHLGSLGFLTPFQFHNFQEQVTNVLEGHAALTLRSRLRCVIQKRKDLPAQQQQEQQKQQQLQHQQSNCYADSPDYGAKLDNNTSSETCSKSPHRSTNILVLNEVVIDRGPSPYLSNIDLYLDGKYITSVQGDGLIISTPTGSTAYAVAAGASMIHPSVPAIMVTPICPHSLSFRPIVVPAGVELKICVAPDSRSTSWVSFDGRNRQELVHGDSLRVTTSIYPVPSICAQDQITDWFASLAECLHWNVRKKQKCLDELSDLTASGSEDTLEDAERAENLLEN